MFDWIKVLASRIHGLLARRELDKDFQRELDAHLDMLTEENIRRGLPPEEARRAARLRLGSTTQLQETHRKLYGLPWLEALFQDLRYGLQQLRRNPGFTAVAVLTLALGIGATTAVFSVVDGVLVEPLPYSRPDSIVAFSTKWQNDGHSIPRLSGGDLVNIESQNRVFDAIGLYVGGEIGVQVANRGEFEHVYMVNPDFLGAFSVTPVYGRLLGQSDAGEAALVGLGFASRVFGSGMAALGKSISVEHRVYQIVGVLQASFEFPNKADIWLAAPASLWNLSRTVYNYHVVARLKSGMGLQQAQAQLDTIAARLSAAFPGENTGKTFVITPLSDELVAPVTSTLWLLMLAVCLLLLISCSNIGNLLMARGAVRSHEISLRMTLGAGRWRIVRQLMVENAILAMLAGALGLFFARLGTKALVYLAPADLPRLQDIRIDQSVLIFAGVVSLLATFIFGLVPAVSISGVDLRESLKARGSQRVSSEASQRLRGALTIAEISLCVMLAVGAVLMFRSFVALTAVNLGFRTEDRLVVYADVPAHAFSEYVRVSGSFGQLLDDLEEIPGVQSVAAAMGVPMGRYGSSGLYSVEGNPTANPPSAGFVLASPGYFTTMGIFLRRGREFAATDRRNAPLVAIVNKALVQQSFRHEDPINRRIKCGLDQPNKWITIVGVVGNTRQNSPVSPPGPEIYMPLSQHPYLSNEFQIVLRTSLRPGALVSPVRQKIHRLYPLAATNCTTLDEMVASSVATPRFRLLLTAAFAILAVALTMVGLYGVVSFLAAQRTHEIGIRMALGAQKRNILTLVLGQGIKLTVMGVGIGIAGAVALTRFLSSLLYGVKPTDPVTFVAVSLILTGVALLACYVPARRATKVDPMVALRYE